MKINDEFGVTPAELATIQDEANRLESLGYTVPDITVKFISAPVNGLAGGNTIIIHPNQDLAELRFTVAHEVGHHNTPKVELNIWDETTWDTYQANEDYANWFAANV